MKTLRCSLYVMWLMSITWAHAAEVQFTVQDSKGNRMRDVAIALIPNTPFTSSEKSAAIIDQINKEFAPRVSVVQKGTLVRFPNSDNIRHHVYSFSDANRFELKLYSGEPSEPVRFDREGLVILGCNIHDWMVAYVLVVNTPYHIVQQANTKATLNVAAGAYQLLIWHPDLGAPITEPLTIENADQHIQRKLKAAELKTDG